MGLQRVRHNWSLTHIHSLITTYLSVWFNMKIIKSRHPSYLSVDSFCILGQSASSSACAGASAWWPDLEGCFCDLLWTGHPKIRILLFPVCEDLRLVVVLGVQDFTSPSPFHFISFFTADLHCVLCFLSYSRKRGSFVCFCWWKRLLVWVSSLQCHPLDSYW